MDPSDLPRVPHPPDPGTPAEADAQGASTESSVPLEIGHTLTRTFAPGEVIFREGDGSQSEAYLVHEGRVEARRLVDGEERVLNTLVKGDLLGEVALFRDGPHSVTAIAVEQVTLLVIQVQRLEHMVRANPELAIQIIRQLAHMASGKI